MGWIIFGIGVLAVIACFMINIWFGVLVLCLLILGIVTRISR